MGSCSCCASSPSGLQVEQGLPWHQVEKGLAGQTIPFIVACLPCARSANRSIIVPYSRCSGCPSFLAMSLLLVCCAHPCPSCVAPAFCVSLLLIPRSVGAPVYPYRTPPLVPPAYPPDEGFTSPYDMDCAVCGWLVTALLPPPWKAPPNARAQFPPLCSTWAPCRKWGGELLMARSACAAFGCCCSACTSWFSCKAPNYPLTVAPQLHTQLPAPKR